MTCTHFRFKYAAYYVLVASASSTLWPLVPEMCHSAPTEVNRFRSLKPSITLYFAIKIWDLKLHRITCGTPASLFHMRRIIFWSRMKAVREVSTAFIALSALYQMKFTRHCSEKFSGIILTTWGTLGQVRRAFSHSVHITLPPPWPEAQQANSCLAAECDSNWAIPACSLWAVSRCQA